MERIDRTTKDNIEWDLFIIAIVSLLFFISFVVFSAFSAFLWATVTERNLNQTIETPDCPACPVGPPCSSCPSCPDYTNLTYDPYVCTDGCEEMSYLVNGYIDYDSQELKDCNAWCLKRPEEIGNNGQ